MYWLSIWTQRINRMLHQYVFHHGMWDIRSAGDIMLPRFPETQDVIISDYVTLLSALLWALLFLSELYHLDISACQWIMQTSVSVSLLYNLSICRDVKSKQIVLKYRVSQKKLVFRISTLYGFFCPMWAFRGLLDILGCSHIKIISIFWDTL